MPNTHSTIIFLSLNLLPLSSFAISLDDLESLRDNPFGGPSPHQIIQEKHWNLIREKAAGLRVEELTKCYYGELLQSMNQTPLKQERLHDIQTLCQQKNPLEDFYERAQKGR